MRRAATARRRCIGRCASAIATRRERLIAAGADVNATNRYGLLPLHLAIAAGDAQLTRWLLDAGADAGAPDRAGEPPLVLAAHIGEPTIAQALLEHGAVVDTTDGNFGQTPLMVAAREGHLELASCSSMRAPTSNAQTAAEEPPRFIPPSESPEGLSRGAGIIRAGWPEGRGKRFPAGGLKTPLLYATREGHLEVARLLVERGASLELADGNGMTPLINAIVNASIFRVNRTGESDHLRVAQLLLDAGANVNAIDWYGADASLGDGRHAQSRARPRTGNDRGIRDEAFALIERCCKRARIRTRARVSFRTSGATSSLWSGRWRGWISRGKRRFCARRLPAI